MSQYVTDTHALYWHFTNDPRLSRTARRIFDEADSGLHQILIPSIVLIEMIYLIEKGRLDATLADQVFGALDVTGGSYRVAPLDRYTAQALRAIPRAAVPDMPDRIITATAHQLGLPLITKDAAIRAAEVTSVIW